MPLDAPLLHEGLEETESVPYGISFTWLNGCLRGNVERTLPRLPGSLQPQTCRDVSFNRSMLQGACQSEVPWWNLVWRSRYCVDPAQLAVLFAQRFALDVVTLSGPMLIKWIVEDPSPLYGLLFVGTFVAKALLESQFSYTKGIAKLRIQSGWMSEVYLRAISGSAESTGRLQNLLAIDCERLSNLTLSLLDLVSVMFQLVGTLVLLYLTISWTCLVAIGLMVCLLPLNHIIMRTISRASKGMMEAKDARSDVLDTMVGAMRYLKAAGLEAWVQKRISYERSKELKSLWVIKLSDAVCVFLWGFMGLGLAASTFTVYWKTTGLDLEGEVIFPAIALFNLVLLPLNGLPWVLNGIAEAAVSLRRVSAYLVSIADQATETKPTSPADAQTVVDVRDALVLRDTFALSIQKLQIQRGELVAIRGHAGKSSLLLFFLRSTQVRWAGAVCMSEALNSPAYVGQSPFIMNGSARENILFGSSLEPQRYAAVLQATLLEAFDDGRILDSGVVSGGEAARISLARALYSRSRVLIVDDVLGSLDTKTRKCVVRSLLEEVVNKGRTVIIVTRVEAIISSAHVVLQIEDGVVTQSRQNVVLGVVDSDEGREELIGNGIDCTPVVERRGIEESHETGSVGLNTYGFYFGHQTLWSILTVISIACMQASKSGSDLLLAFRLGIEDASDFMPTYLAIVLVCLVATLVRSFAFAMGGLQAASALHQRILGRIINWPYSLFASCAKGELSNRLVVDIATVDDSLPFIVNIALAQIFGLLGIVVVLFVSVGREAPFLIIAFLLLGFWYRSTQRQYIACSREVKRLEASRRTPLHSLVLDVSAEGLEHIRAYRREEFFSRKFDGALEAYIQTLFVSTGLASWLALRLQMMAAFVGLVIVALGSPDQLPTSNSMEGIAIAYIIPITGLLGGLVSSLSEVERQMVSVERLFELFRRGPEAEEEGGSTQSQVSSGSLVLSHVHYHYPGLDDYAIRDISFELVEGSRTVVVGRSGCGKSTLLCTILGLLPVSCGDILFGGIRQSKISRGELQALIGYLPQTPVLFEASVRENLDPKRHHCDDELQLALQVTCLEHLHLDDVIMPSALTAASRVFFSLARLVLLRPRYLLLDEPSSALNTSEMTALFAVMNSTFSAEVTILETSHALERALEADTVVVLEKGAVLELGRPDDLLSRSYSEFASMLLANDSTHPLVTN